MATITIIYDLTYRTPANVSKLIPLFVRNSIRFYVEGADIAGTYATVKIDNFEFMAVKTYTSGMYDYYLFDATSVLTNMMTLPYEVVDASNLFYSPDISIRLYNSSDVLITSVAHTPVVLSFAYSDIKTYSEVDIYLKGSSRPIYHNGKRICFFWCGSSGIFEFFLGSTSDNVEVAANEYTIADLSVLSIFGTGTLTSPSLATFSIPLYYKPPYGDHEIAWLNRDGGWSFWNFRQISSEIKVKKSNEIATYYPTNYETISKSRMISAEKTVEYTFDTLAYDPTHFAQLCEIQESLAVIWNNKLMMVSACNSLTSVCKQNLRFTLKLQSNENIAGY